MDMTALVARVAHQEFADRELDLALANLFAPHPWRWEPKGGEDAVTCDRYGPGEAGNPCVSLEKFTRHVEDAVLLGYPVIDGETYWRVWKTLPSEGLPYAYTATFGHAGQQECNFGHTPALAICAAVLSYVQINGFQKAKG